MLVHLEVLTSFMLKPSLKDFVHNLASMWNKCDNMVVWTLFGIAFLWNWNENWPFPVLWPLLIFFFISLHWSLRKASLFLLLSSSERWCFASAAFNMPANLENSAVATALEKVSFHSIPKKGNAKECSNYCTIALISHASKVMLNILQASLQ